MPLLRSQSHAVSGDAPPVITTSAAFASENSQKLEVVNGTNNAQANQTFSFWFRLSGAPGVIFSAISPDTNSHMSLGVDNSNQLFYFQRTASATTGYYIFSNVLIRDPTAWYHAHVEVEQGASAGQRIRCKLNGVPLAASVSTELSGTPIWGWVTSTHRIGETYALDDPWDGGLALIEVIDGAVIDVSEFGEFDQIGRWVPKLYTGTYGTTGLRCDFTDGADLGKNTADDSTLGDLTNINGVAQRIDSPADTYPIFPILDNQGQTWSAWGAGLRPLNRNTGANVYTVRGTTVLPLTGKWCLRGVCNITNDNNYGMGITAASGRLYGTGAASVRPNVYLEGTGNVRNKDNAIIDSSPAAYTNGDMWDMVVDVDAGTVQWYRNGAPNGTAINFTAEFRADDRIQFAILSYDARGFVLTAGEDGSAPIAGSSWLNSRNLPAPDIADPRDYVETRERPGNSGSAPQSLQMGFAEGISFCKQYTGSFGHRLLDSARGGVRGLAIEINANSQQFELPSGNNYLIASPGRDIAGNDGSINNSAHTYVDMHMRQAVEPGVAVLTYTGDGQTGRAIAHGLGRVPSMFFVGRLDAASSLYFCHERLAPTNPWSYDLAMENSRGRGTNGIATQPPDATNVYVSGGSGTNGNTLPYVMYVFAQVPGFSAFFDYTGNNDLDGPLVGLDFTPEWWFMKASATNRSWFVWTRGLNPTNPAHRTVRWESALAGRTGDDIDRLAAGLKIRYAAGGAFNALGEHYIGAAFAQFPFANIAPRAV